MSKELKDMTFDEVVDEQLASMIYGLAHGTPWRSLVWQSMEMGVRWRMEREAIKSTTPTSTK